MSCESLLPMPLGNVGALLSLRMHKRYHLFKKKWQAEALIFCMILIQHVTNWSIMADSPCIMCVQYHEGVQYCGVFSTMAEIMMHVEGYLEYREGYSVLCGIS